MYKKRRRKKMSKRNDSKIKTEMKSRKEVKDNAERINK